MSNHILNYFAKTHATHIHANHKEATRKLVEILDCQENENVLEIGFGTGATLVQLTSSYPKTFFYGIEASKEMYKKAKKRIQFCLLNKRSKLYVLGENYKTPFENNFFDKVYAESVLAIQEKGNLKVFLNEIKRILKSDGVLVFNETIWLDSTNLKTIKNINNKGKKVFGIIQANSQTPYLKDWIELLEELNLHPEELIKLNDIKKTKGNKFNIIHTNLSNLYTIIGKTKLLYNKKLKREWELYCNEMKSITPNNAKLMEGVIIKSRKEKTT